MTLHDAGSFLVDEFHITENLRACIEAAAGDPAKLAAAVQEIVERGAPIGVRELAAFAATLGYRLTLERMPSAAVAPSP